MVFDWLTHYQRHWSLLQAEIKRIGREIERSPYQDLDRDAEAQPLIECHVNGYPVRFQVDRYDTLPNGDLAICIDAYGGPPTLFGMKPSYRFFKQPNGNVYY